MKIDVSKGISDISLSLKTLRNRKKRIRKKNKFKLRGCNITIGAAEKTVNSCGSVKISQGSDSRTSFVEVGQSMNSLKLQEQNYLNSNLESIGVKHELVIKKRTFDTKTVNTEAFTKKPKEVQSDVRLKECTVTVTNNTLNSNNVCKPTEEERKKIRIHKRNLPVFNARGEIIEIIRKEPCAIFIGDTACGKSTQIPQYILEGGILTNKVVAVTQPRRVAAITIAERVSEELGVVLGQKVGYCVRFEDVTSSFTKIKYVTDGMLLRESINDPLLLQYSVVVLDEAHERALHTDVLFGVVKKAQHVRKASNAEGLKIVVMSATMNYNHFSKFFDDAPVYHLRGREYKITILNSLKAQEDYVYSALVTVFKIHKENSCGDILVFCTGSEEIQSMVTEVLKAASELSRLGCCKLLPYALYAALPAKQQKQVFIPAPKGSRKVIFSTNIAETSVTIPGVKYVIDTGMVKARTYNSTSGFDLLKIIKISKAQAEQRAGRAGREFDGQCYRLYTLEDYQNFKDYSVPEIQRCSLAGVILQIVALGVQNIQQFHFIDRPSDENINSAIEQLILLGAIKSDSTSDLCQLTEDGKMMVNFPLDPKFSKIIIASKKFKCTDEILTIISLLTVESLFICSPTERDVFTKVWKKFASQEGDHVMLLNIYKAFKSSRNSMEWCQQNFVNFKSMKNVLAVRKQLSQLCHRANISPSSCGSDTSFIRRCLATGMFMNSAQLYNNKGYKTFANNQKVHLHPSSCLFMSKPSFCIYTELVETSKCYMRNISVVEDDWLKDAAPIYFKNKRFVGYQLLSVSN